jgi:hypothetical protein
VLFLLILTIFALQSLEHCLVLEESATCYASRSFDALQALIATV